MDAESLDSSGSADLGAVGPLQGAQRSTVDRRKKVNRPPHPVVCDRIATHLGKALRVRVREPAIELEEFVGPGNAMRFAPERPLHRDQSRRTLLQTAAVNARVRPQKVRRIHVNLLQKASPPVAWRARTELNAAIRFRLR